MRILNHSSCFRFFLLFSITIFLTPLNDHRTALVSAAVHWNFGPNTPDPGEPANNDYPTDDRVISNAFVRPRRDQTVVSSMSLGGSEAPGVNHMIIVNGQRSRRSMMLFPL